jgi:hypothetical protein
MDLRRASTVEHGLLIFVIKMTPQTEVEWIAEGYLAVEHLKKILTQKTRARNIEMRLTSPLARALFLECASWVVQL